MALDPSKNTLLHLAAVQSVVFIYVIDPLIYRLPFYLPYSFSGRSKVVESLLTFISGEINSINLDGKCRSIDWIRYRMSTVFQVRLLSTSPLVIQRLLPLSSIVFSLHNRSNSILPYSFLPRVNRQLTFQTLEGETVMHTVVKLPESETKQVDERWITLSRKYRLRRWYLVC